MSLTDYAVANIILSNGCHRFYSAQAIAQITEQIFNLREQQQLDQEEFMDFLKDLDLPIDLSSDYKVHSIKDIIDQVVNIPKIKINEHNENDDYQEYNTKRQELLDKINQIQALQNKTQLIRNYRELIRNKIGERSNIQKNLPTSKNTELSNEITKLRINLERYKTLSDSQKEKLKQLMRGYDE